MDLEQERARELGEKRDDDQPLKRGGGRPPEIHNGGRRHDEVADDLKLEHDMDGTDSGSGRRDGPRRPGRSRSR